VVAIVVVAAILAWIASKTSLWLHPR